MAYAALVRSAAVSGYSTGADDRESAEGDSEVWFCIEVLLDAIRNTAAVSSEQLHRLHLALIACVPSVSLPLLPRLLEEVKALIQSSSTQEGRPEEMRGALVQALFKAILQDVGDAEKEFLVGWWLDHIDTLADAVGGRAAEGGEQEISVSRL